MSLIGPFIADSNTGIAGLAVGKTYSIKTPVPALRTKGGQLTRYGLRCGYVDFKRGKKLWMEYNTYHVSGTDAQGKCVWESFDTLTQAREYLSLP